MATVYNNTPYFQSNQNVTNTGGNMTPQFANKLNNIISNLQYQLTQIETMFTEIGSTNGNVTSLQEALANAASSINEITNSLAYMDSALSYTNMGEMVLAADSSSIAWNTHTRSFPITGRVVTLNGGSIQGLAQKTTYYVYVDNETNVGVTGDINAVVNTATRYCMGKITTAGTDGTASVGPFFTLTLGQIFQ